MTPTAPVTLADRFRREWYLVRFLLAMQDYPGAQSKRVRADLRADLDAAAGEVGMHQALHDLGSPRRLADGFYAELVSARPRYLDGAIVTGLLGLLLMLLPLGYAAGSADTLLAGGGGHVELSYLGSPLSITATEDEVSVESTLSIVVALAFAGVLFAGFAVSARLWRLRPALRENRARSAR